MLSGTPTSPGTYNFTVTDHDTVGASGSQSYTLTIYPPLAITTATLPNWTAARGYEDIRYEKCDEGIARITINRPEVRNAFPPRGVMTLPPLLEMVRVKSAAGAGVQGK